MDVRLLGPLEVHAAGRPILVGGPRQRALLALLALEADRVVPTSRVLETIWDEPPESGAKAVQMCVSTLRKALPPDVLVTARGGYRLRIEPREVDAHRFEGMVSEAQAALDRDPARAAALLREALALWQGPALAEFSAERFAATEAARLEALREAALELRVDAELALGAAAELIPELESLVAHHPLRERLRGQLMLALYRCGRQADALAAYHEVRSTLVEELGIDPGPELQRLHRAILQQLPDLDLPTPVAAEQVPPAPPADAPIAALEERKLVTALFADLADSTALGEQLDPERLRIVLGEYFRTVSAVIERWGGTVEKFIGDAVMAVFGIPAVHEDDAERALTAALELLERLDALNASLVERHGISLAVKIGINTGDVVAGGPTGQFMVTGDAVNSAARLEQAAAPGEILVGERTYSAARHAFEFADRGELDLKGKATRMHALRLVGARFLHSRRRARFASRLVGRERELVLLETLSAATVEEHRPQLVVVAGQAGIGKTRLVEEFLGRVPGTVHRGRCLSYGEGITYWALREIVWSAAGILLDDAAPEAASKLRSLVGALPGLTSDERKRVLFALGATAGLAVPGERIDALSPEAVHEELMLAWPLFVSALALPDPLVVVVEDIHWAEPPLLGMLDSIVSRAAGPILVVATSRPEGELLPSLQGRHFRANQISLEPLGDRQARELLAELLPTAPAPLAETILAATEGNPFFLEELAWHVAELGSDPDQALEIPDSVRALLAARIDSLPGAEKAVLQDAAVIGKVFWTTALDATGGRDARTELAMLENRGLVVTRPSSQLAGQPELTFRHALIREVAYQSIPRARRARAHAAAAEWIELLAGDRRDEFVELIAHHAAAAADPQDAELAWPEDTARRDELRGKAIARLLAAGNAARERYAVDQAASFADRALGLAATEHERLAALELKAETAHTAVRAEEAWSRYLEALDLAGRLGDRAAGARLAASATLLWSRFVGAMPEGDWRSRAAEIVTTWLERLGESTETFEVGALLVGRSLLGFDEIRSRSSEAALADAERALAVAERISSPRLLSYAVDATSMLMGEDGLCSAAAAGRLAADARPRILDRWTAHEMFVNAAHLLASAGELDEALVQATEATREAATLSTHQQIHAAAAQAYALVPLGRLNHLLEATGSVPQLIEEERKSTCYHGFVALAGHVLAAQEVGDAARAERGLALFDETVPAGPDPVGERIRAIELLLRVRGVERSRELLQDQALPSKRTAAIRRMRVALQIEALCRNRHTVNELAGDARRLADEGCAPVLRGLADWAQALVVGDWAGAEKAALEIGRLREVYLSARLLADLVPLVAPGARRRLGEEVARRLERIGAVTSAAEVRERASLH
jgi:class 3 adenylate cyclase